MKKLLTIISAIVLAVCLTGGYMAYQRGDLSWNGFITSIEDLFISEPETETLPVISEINTEAEYVENENLSYDEHLEKGDYYFERGFLTFASNEYVRAANLEPNRVTPYLKLVDTHFELRNYSKALKNAEIVLQLDPNQIETRFDMIQIYIKLSDFDTAKNLADSYPDTGVADGRVLFYKGLLSALFGNHDLARKYLKEAVVATSNESLKAKAEEVLGAYREFDFTQAAEDIYLKELLARSFNKIEEFEMAVHLLKDILGVRSDLRDGWILLGFAYLNLENYQFALVVFDKAYSLDSEWPTTQYFLGITHKELGHFDEAILYFNYALDNGFEPPVVIFRHLADLYFETEEYDKSAEAYEKVLEVSKGDVNAFVRPVWLYIDFLDNKEKAVKLAETAVLTFPDSAMSYNLLGWAYVGQDDTKAERNLKKALEMEPNLAAAHYNLGHLYEAQNRTELALESYQTAYSLDNSGSIGNMAAAAYNELLKESLAQ
jgi:tetratricopeptide (TPR) repeat protein